jgi:hypothetical protein
MNGHQGGVNAASGEHERPAPASGASLPIRQNDTGGANRSQPREAKPPKLHHGLAPQGLYLHKWVREIIERDGTPEQLIHEAIRRVAEHPTEERILDAQGILNELGRTGEHADLLNSLMVTGIISSLLQKGG